MRRCTQRMVTAPYSTHTDQARFERSGGPSPRIGTLNGRGKETEERTQIDHVRARVNFVELTHTAQSELAFVLDEVVKENEEIKGNDVPTKKRKSVKRKKNKSKVKSIDEDKLQEGLASDFLNDD